MEWIERKPVWINGQQVFVFPWALAWDALLAAPEKDFHDVWAGNAILTDEDGNRIFPDEGLRHGQQVFVIRKRNRDYSVV